MNLKMKGKYAQKVDYAWYGIGPRHGLEISIEPAEGLFLHSFLCVLRSVGFWQS